VRLVPISLHGFCSKHGHVDVSLSRCLYVSTFVESGVAHTTLRPLLIPPDLFRNEASGTVVDLENGMYNTLLNFLLILRLTQVTPRTVQCLIRNDNQVS
jgi:hypothetical protein